MAESAVTSVTLLLLVTGADYVHERCLLVSNGRGLSRPYEANVHGKRYHTG